MHSEQVILINQALLMTTGLLGQLTCLSTAYVKGLMNLSDDERCALLQMSGMEQSRNIIYWELPFLLNTDRLIKMDSQWGVSVLMGVCRLHEQSQVGLTRPFLQLIKAVTIHLNAMSDGQNVPQHFWNDIFHRLNDLIIICVTQNDLADLAWSAWTSLFPFCSKEAVLSVF